MLSIPVEELAVGDYISEVGTIETIVERAGHYNLRFKNGKEVSVAEGTDFFATQGGRFDH